ncbi:MAG: B12-binding domain-containing radical SAM protein [Bacteriovoracaceae bacterium]|nr:B12-binding domain-containing radical SAM protein [Bacteriovoracaceae bacterium]
MKILFVHYGREHLGIEYLSAVLKKDGHDVEIVIDPALFCVEDNVIHNQFLSKLFSQKKQITNKVRTFNPDIVAFSPYTTTYKWSISMAKSIKDISSAKIIFGGVHSTVLPDMVIKESCVDIVVVGDGEKIILQVIDSINSETGFSQIPNLHYKEDNQCFATERVNACSKLDELPYPDKLLFSETNSVFEDYFIMTTKGCPFSCSYCTESFFNKHSDLRGHKRRSVESVILELVHAKKHFNIDRVMFFDSILFMDHEWMESLLAEYKDRVQLPFRCTGHVSFVSDDMIRLMAEAGCYNIDFGVQSFNPHIRSKILNRMESNETIERAFSICENYKISFDVDIMLGIPEETKSDYELVIHKLMPFKYLNRIKCFNLSYFPRLQISEYSLEKGFLKQSDYEGLLSGDTTSWFHSSTIQDPEWIKLKECFEVFFKIFPLIPNWLSRVILKTHVYRSFRYIPSPVVIFAQLFIGILRKDWRFYLYIMNYIKLIRKLIFG